MKKVTYLVNAGLPLSLNAMNDLKERSGPWSGFWIQSQVRGYMRLRLQFYGNQLIGGGSDCAGWFEIRGQLSTEDGIVRFSKRYSSYSVEYEGRWDGMMIAGLWTMRHPGYYGQSKYIERGDFEMWPETEDTELALDFTEEPLLAALPA